MSQVFLLDSNDIKWRATNFWDVSPEKKTLTHVSSRCQNGAQIFHDTKKSKILIVSPRHQVLRSLFQDGFSLGSR